MIVIKEDVANQKIKFILRHKTYSSENIEVRSTDDEQLQSTTPTIASWSATTDEDVGQGTGNLDVISVTSAADVERGWAFLTDTEGFWELVNIIGVDTTQNELYIAGYPNRQYSSGAGITPAEGYITVGSDVYSDEQDFFVIFSYISDGEFISWQEFGYVHERPAGNPLSIQKIYSKWPQLSTQQYQSNRGHTYEELLDLAFDDIRSELWSAGRKVEMYRGAAEALREVLIYAFGKKLAEMGVVPFAEGSAIDFYDMMSTQYEMKKNELLTTRQWIDLDDDDTEESGEVGRGRRLLW